MTRGACKMTTSPSSNRKQTEYAIMARSRVRTPCRSQLTMCNTARQVSVCDYMSRIMLSGAPHAP
eukprot:scaffold133702_cov37-Tisochrysis_lutea.AAC.3